MAKGQAFTRFAIVEGLVPLIKKGESQQEAVLMMLQKIIDMLDGLTSDPSSPFLSGARTEVRSCATAIVSLLQPCKGHKAAEVQAVMDTADKTGHRFLLKNAVHQVPCYEKLQAEFLEVSVAEPTLMPALTKALEETRSLSEASVQEAAKKLKETVPKLALWHNKLRVGSTMAVETEIARVIAKCVNMATSEVEVTTALEIAKLYLDVPLSAVLRDGGLQALVTRVEKSTGEAKEQITEMKTREAKEALEAAVLAFSETPSAPALWSTLRSTLDATQKEHLAEGHGVWVAQALGKAIPHFMKVCSVAQLRCFESDLTTEAGESAQQAVGEAMSTLRSLGRHLSSARSTDLQAILAVAEAFELLTDARQPLQKHKGSVKEFFLEDKDEGLAATSLLSSYQKLTKLKQSTTVEGAQFYLNPLEKPIQEAGKLIDNLKAVASQTLSALLADSVTAVSPLANGAAKGESWKANVVGEGAGWSDIKRDAKPLLEGDLTKNLFVAFSKLQKDHYSDLPRGNNPSRSSDTNISQ